MAVTSKQGGSFRIRFTHPRSLSPLTSPLVTPNTGLRPLRNLMTKGRHALSFSKNPVFKDFIKMIYLTPATSTKTPPERNPEGACSNKMSVVGVKGLEPSTSRSQTARASQLRHTPRS